MHELQPPSIAKTQSDKSIWDKIIGADEGFQALAHKAKRFAGHSEPVLLLGETGTGKSLMARAVHESSPFADGPFIEFPCSSFNDNLIESELFGHARGAFTGAQANYPGKILLAQNGTLFLDEVGELSLPSQARLLHFLQEGRYYPVGANQPRAVNVRVIAATHRDLRAMIAAGQFREDLFFRLSVMWLCLPPLRERKDDLPMLADRFIDEMSFKAGRKFRLSDTVKEQILIHDWPGNVRELQNVLKRAVIDLEPEQDQIARLEFSYLPAAAAATLVINEQPVPDPIDLPRIRDALVQSNGSIQNAAKVLGVSRYALYRRLKKIGVKRNAALAWYAKQCI